MPLLVLAALVIVVWQLAGNYPNDDALKWTVIAAVFTGGAALIALIGLPFAIWQLATVQLEQAQIAAQLAAQPKVEMGFSASVVGDPSTLETEQTVAVEWWPPSPNEYRAHRIDLCALNIGTRSAHNPRWRVVLPRGVGNIRALRSGDEVGNENGTFWLEARDSILNPQGRREIPLVFDITQGAPADLEFVCTWSSEDAAAATRTLMLHFRSA